MNEDSAMNGPAEVSRQVRVETVWTLFRDLARTLFAKGHSAETIRSIYSGRIQATCEACGAELASHDLMALLDAASDTEFPNPKLERLHKGYCLMGGCNSYFYRLRFLPVEGIDWNAALPEAEALPAKLEAEAKRREPFTWRGFVRGPRFRVGVLVMVMLLLLVYRNWYFNGTLPFVSKRFEAAAPHPEFSRENTGRIPTAGSIRAATAEKLVGDPAPTNSRIKAAPAKR